MSASPHFPPQGICSPPILSQDPLPPLHPPQASSHLHLSNNDALYCSASPTPSSSAHDASHPAETHHPCPHTRPHPSQPPCDHHPEMHPTCSVPRPHHYPPCPPHNHSPPCTASHPASGLCKNVYMDWAVTGSPNLNLSQSDHC